MKLIPFIFLLILTPFTPFLDLTIARFFYEDGHFFENGVTKFLYRYGEIFGFIVGGISCLVFIFSKKWRKGACIMILTLVLGAGILINSVLKEYWGRPRPKQVTEFGGTLSFRPYYQPNFSKERVPQKSFPSGHAAMGFYYIALILVGRRYNSTFLIGVGSVLTIVLGVGLMATRVMQGGHFFSDTLVSFVLMWYTAFFVDRYIGSSSFMRKLV